jgi:hypothetical protein
MGRVRQEVGPLAGVEAGLTLAAAREQLVDAPAEAPHEVGHELERAVREHLALSRVERCAQLDAAR